MVTDIKEVEKMIAKVMKDRDCTRTDAVYHLATIGTGKLLALKRYKESLPQDKPNKGILTFTSERARKKLAPKAAKLTPKAAASEDETPVSKPKPKPKPKRKASKPKAAKTSDDQMVIESDGLH